MIKATELGASVFYFRDHYVEGRMRGAAPNKKIPAASQKNDV